MKDMYQLTKNMRDILIARATGEYADDDEYCRVRRVLLAEPHVRAKLPSYVENCHDLRDFWSWIKAQNLDTSESTYAGRRAFLRSQFHPLLASLENQEAPGDRILLNALPDASWKEVQRVWHIALDRRTNDPDGAITLARTLLESVCKHIIEAEGGTLDQHDDLPKLYKTASTLLNLAPSQHEEQLVRSILGGCASIVGGLSALRNKSGDAHGKGRGQVRLSARHAGLAVNLSGSVSAFLIETWKYKQQKSAA